MGKQINYFGGAESLAQIIDQFLLVFDSACFVYTQLPDKDVPIQYSSLAKAPRSIDSSIVVFSEGNSRSIKWRPAPDCKMRVDLQTSPVIEVDPAHIDERSSTANQGRLYCAADTSQTYQAFDIIARNLKRNFHSIEFGHRYWIAEDAKRAKLLKFFLGKIISNPLYEKKQEEG